MKIVVSAVLLVGLLSTGCAGTNPMLTDEDWDAWNTAMHHLRVGSTESVSQHFNFVTQEGSIGILDTKAITREGNNAQAYAIGYLKNMIP